MGKGKVRLECWGLSTAASKPFQARKKAKQFLFRAKNCLFDEIIPCSNSQAFLVTL
jgi:hypothetical protein